ncbi:MAG: hypothetical protein GY833_16655 [Aestuariibacter sp.]|nr:hypothetical protein [Aestuariibacter sp.]
MKKFLLIAFLIVMYAPIAYADSSWGSSGIPALQAVTDKGATTTTMMGIGGGYGSTGCSFTATGDLYCDGVIFDMPNALATFGDIEMPELSEFCFDSATNTVCLYGQSGYLLHKGPVYNYQALATSLYDIHQTGAGWAMDISGNGTSAGVLNIDKLGAGYGLAINQQGTGQAMWAQAAGESTLYLTSQSEDNDDAVITIVDAKEEGEEISVYAKYDSVPNKFVFNLDNKGRLALGGDITVEAAAATDHGTHTDITVLYASGSLVVDGSYYTAGNITASGTITVAELNLGNEDLTTYDEGTGSMYATATDASCAHTTNDYYYTQVGNVINVDFTITTTSCTAGAAGDMYLTALPATSKSDGTYRGACALGYVHNVGTLTNNMTAYIGSSATTITIQQTPTGGGASAVVPIDLNGFSLIGHCTYLTD